ncbi:MAG: GNAT family N-acetyltransferase [Woeseiaceae bacterium]|jgi:GNAT superfamily N-acetyltransferase|nr:GNAT family N-acetyltransferase [Woeseiaceae bacterium]
MSELLQNCRLRQAGPGDAKVLSSLAFRSKASWGYDIEFMKRCRDELTYSGEDIDAPHFRFHVCELDNELVGFYALEILNKIEAELEGLFVKPDLIRKGIGKLLIDHVRSEAELLGIQTITIQGDPNAEAFYESIGARSAGYRESASIPGRFLPVFKLEIDKGK